MARPKLASILRPSAARIDARRPGRCAPQSVSLLDFALSACSGNTLGMRSGVSPNRQVYSGAQLQPYSFINVWRSGLPKDLVISAFITVLGSRLSKGLANVSFYQCLGAPGCFRVRGISAFINVVAARPRSPSQLADRGLAPTRRQTIGDCKQLVGSA